MKRLLITGFDPFGSNDINPSWEAVKALPDLIDDYILHKLSIPTAFDRAARLIMECTEEFSPDTILSIGLAAGRNAVTPERIAVNIRDAAIPDNDGNQPVGERIIADGPAAYFSTIPVEAIAEAILAMGIPATVSNSAGTFVCNDVLYTLLHYYAKTRTRIGFIHVPYLPEQGEPSLPLRSTIDALIAAIKCL